MVELVRFAHVSHSLLLQAAGHVGVNSASNKQMRFASTFCLLLSTSPSGEPVRMADAIPVSTATGKSGPAVVPESAVPSREPQAGSYSPADLVSLVSLRLLVSFSTSVSSLD